jgi:hypothetical protein
VSVANPPTRTPSAPEPSHPEPSQPKPHTLWPHAHELMCDCRLRHVGAARPCSARGHHSAMRGTWAPHCYARHVAIVGTALPCAAAPHATLTRTRRRRLVASSLLACRVHMSSQINMRPVRVLSLSVQMIYAAHVLGCAWFLTITLDASDEVLYGRTSPPLAPPPRSPALVPDHTVWQPKWIDRWNDGTARTAHTGHVRVSTPVRAQCTLTVSVLHCV